MTDGGLFYRYESPLFRQNMGAADLESEGFDGKTIMGGLRHWDGVYSTYTDMAEMLDAMIATPKEGGFKRNTKNPNRRTSGVIWFHNWAGFDGGRFVEAILTLVQDRPEITADIIPQGQSKFIAVILTVPQAEPGRFYRVTLADSMAVIPASLEKISKAFVPLMPKSGKCKEHDFEQDNPVWWSPDCETCLDYLQRDVDCLYASMRELESRCHSIFKAPMGITAGSIAWKAALATVPEGHVYYRSAASTEQWLRPAVHGGFIWPGHQRGNRGPTRCYDMSGAYGDSLRQGVPYGHPTYRDAYRADVPGIWDMTVTVPDDIAIPILPGPAGGPAYPTGTFRGKFTQIEVEYAEKLGCTVDMVHEGITWDRLEYPFSDFINECEALEYPADGSECDKAVKDVVKLMRNSLPGRFATRPDIKQWRLGTIPEEGETPYVCKETGEELPLMCKAGEIEGAAYVHPEWNAYITARQRIRVHQVLMAAGEGAYYADTDSVFLDPVVADRLIREGAFNVGIGYGKYHEEGYGVLVVAGPKNKIMLGYDGETKSTGKGIPAKQRKKNLGKQVTAAVGNPSGLSGKALAAWRERELEIRFDSPYGFKQRLLDPSKPYGTQRKRSFSVLESSDSWYVTDEGRIRPKPSTWRPGSP